MRDRNDAFDAAAWCPCLDELLCEYVDEVMDPAVRVVFEECLQADAALALQVEELRQVRALLQHYGCTCSASCSDLSRRLHERMQAEGREALLPRSHLASMMLLLLAAGLLLSGAPGGASRPAPASSREAARPVVGWAYSQPVAGGWQAPLVHRALERTLQHVWRRPGRHAVFAGMISEASDAAALQRMGGAP